MLQLKNWQRNRDDWISTDLDSPQSSAAECMWKDATILGGSLGHLVWGV